MRHHLLVMPEDAEKASTPNMQAAGQRVAEGVATNLITAAVLWLVAVWFGLVQSQGITILALTVAFLAVPWGLLLGLGPLIDRPWRPWVSFGLAVLMVCLTIATWLRV